MFELEIGRHIVEIIQLVAPKNFVLRRSDQRLALRLMGTKFNPFTNERFFQPLELEIGRHIA